MSSLLAEFRALEKRLKELQNNKILQHEIEFENKLIELIKAYNVSPTKAIEIIKGAYPSSPKSNVPGSKVYKNPHTGETAEVKTMLAKPVVEWVKEHGKEEVKKWVQAA
jgi:predicted small secreted protein